VHLHNGGASWNCTADVGRDRNICNALQRGGLVHREGSGPSDRTIDQPSVHHGRSVQGPATQLFSLGRHRNGQVHVRRSAERALMTMNIRTAWRKDDLTERQEWIILATTTFFFIVLLLSPLFGAFLVAVCFGIRALDGIGLVLATRRRTSEMSDAHCERNAKGDVA
jgi:hypothetical protein